METNGTIYRILQQEEVTFGDGTKKIKGGFVIMREGEYPKPVAFELFGEDRLSLLNGLTLGMPVKVSFYAESREGKNGKFYTTLRCFNIVHPGATGNMPPATDNPSYSWSPTGEQKPSGQGNDLPWSDDEVPF